MMNKHFSKEKWKYLWHTFLHPLDGYYWIRRKDKGSVLIAILLVVLFSVSFSVNRYLASFVVNDVNARNVNLLTELIGVVLLFILICTANWSVTSLLNGEGRFKDIIIALGYATIPLNLTFIPATVYSHAVAKDEEAFYMMIIGAGIVWAFVMALTGIMQIHGYSLGKTLLTLILTMVALFVIIFLILLLFNLVGQVYNFFYSIYMELLFRT